jgi:hypothetical protein
MTEPYEPFPEAELRALACWHEQVAATWKANSKMEADHIRRSAACRNALAAHNALRDRFLEQSMLVRALQSTQPSEAA